MNARGEKHHRNSWLAGIALGAVGAAALWLAAFGGFAAEKQVPWAATQPLEAITGLRLPAGWQELGEWQDERHFQTSVKELPKHLDWRECVLFPPVKRQAWNDCWAWGTAGVLELLAAYHGVLGNERVSVQQVIDCSGEGTAARGGYFAHEMHLSGAAAESDYPYNGRDNRCRQVKPRWKLARWGYVGARGRRPTDTELKLALVEHGPIGVTITANGALQRFSGDGKFQGCTNGQTNHIVVIVGWDDEEGVWFMRNSWGPTHGKDGYAKIPFGCSRIGEIATWADLEKAGPHAAAAEAG